jgi:hypothetical protein
VPEDRLIKKLRRKKIAHYEAANQYLEQDYLPDHNRRFALAAAQPEDYHGRKPTACELRQSFRLASERVISYDWVIRYEGRWLQLQPGQRRYGPTKSQALVCEWEDGALEVYYRGQRIQHTQLTEPFRKLAVPRQCVVRAIVVRKPKAGHPWRQGYPNQHPPVNPAHPVAPVGIRTSASP